VGLSLFLQRNLYHVSVGVDILPHVSTGTHRWTCWQLTLNLCLFKHQISCLPPLGALFRSANSFYDISPRKSQDEIIAFNDYAFHLRSGKLNTADFHQYAPHNLELVLYLRKDAGIQKGVHKNPLFSEKQNSLVRKDAF
jgi:hypothetical protein